MSRYVKLILFVFLINLIPISVLVNTGSVEIAPLIILNIILTPLYFKILFNRASKIKKTSPEIVTNSAIVVGWVLISIPLLILGYMLKNRLRDEAPYKNVVIGLSVILGMFSIPLPFFLTFLLFELSKSENSFFFFTISIYLLLFSYYAFARPFYHTLRILKSLKSR